MKAACACRFLASGLLQRTFVSGIAPPTHSEPAWWFAFVGNKILVHVLPPAIDLTAGSAGSTSEIPQRVSLEELELIPVRTQFLGWLDDRPCYSAELTPETIVPKGMALLGLRELYGTLPDDLYAVSMRAVQIIEWDRTHQYCGHCATPTTQLPSERAKRCPTCGLVNYPRLSPAVIVLISRGEELLLARAHRFPPGMYSVLAGFVEPGESLEETVVREVREEVGVEIENLQYFGSQPWPFPNSLMIGFTAIYASGEIVIEPEELVDAGWFHRSKLPQLPPPLSIARKLIDRFLSEFPT